MGYRQLTQAQRYQISALQTVGRSQRQIAQMLGCHNTTISREIKRNSGAKGYDPDQAQRHSDQRRASAYKAHKRASSLIHWVSDLIRKRWSPDQIAGVMVRIGSGVRVSRQWIYELIHRDRRSGGDLWTFCRQPRSRRDQREKAKQAGLGKIPNRTGIEQRPAEVDTRLTIGHWEGDTVLHGHKQSGIATLVERRSGYLLAGRLPRVKSSLAADAIIRLLRPIRGAVKTLTLDNGSEFAEHQRMAGALSMATYFCDQYCSGQRGTNENTNGLIRQYYPKGTDFSKLSQSELNQTVDELNNRPRKRLGYRTPAEVFWGEYSGVLKTGGAALIT
jgi:IS30 family transposase